MIRAISQGATALPPFGAGCRSVLLRHDLPDGTWHVDWLIESASAADESTRRMGIDPQPRNVVTFRLEQKASRADGGPGLSAGSTLVMERHCRSSPAVSGA